jgi:hypothetical protein
MGFKADYRDFNTPLKDLGADVSKLTAKAGTLLEGDLVALAWGQNTTNTEKLGVRDLQSVVDAFAGHPFRGRNNSELVGSSCCCTCTPACCCTAAAVVDSVAA